MIEKDAATSNKNLYGKARKSKEIIETTLSKSFEKTQPTDEFRQTLLKSGLDVSQFENDEPKSAQISNSKSLDTDTANSTKSRNELLEVGLIQSSDKSATEDKKSPARFNRWQHLTAIAGILAIIVLQSAFQFFFVQDENQRVAESIIKNDLPVGETSEKLNELRISETSIPESKSDSKLEVENEYKKSAKIPTAAKKDESKFQRESKVNTSRTASQKKEKRESNTERLRRAERILTGI